MIIDKKLHRNKNRTDIIHDHNQIGPAHVVSLAVVVRVRLDTAAIQVCAPKKVNHDHQFHSGQSLEEGA